MQASGISGMLVLPHTEVQRYQMETDMDYMNIARAFGLLGLLIGLFVLRRMLGISPYRKVRHHTVDDSVIYTTQLNQAFSADGTMGAASASASVSVSAPAHHHAHDCSSGVHLDLGGGFDCGGGGHH
jgi:hypothetical protein